VNIEPSLPHVAMNAHLLSLKQSYRSAGISWYIYNLLKALPRVSADVRATVFLNDPDFRPDAGMTLHRTAWPARHPIARIVWEQTVLPLLLARAGVDLLHALAFVAPVAAPVPFVTTVYDASFMRFPEAFRPFNRWYLKTFTAISSRRAKAVIAISESTRQDVITFFGVAPEKVHTIYCGVDAEFRPLPLEQVAAFKRAHNLPDAFIFRLGTLEPRKNVEGLILAYAEWHRRDNRLPPLVIAGGKGWYYRHIFNLVGELGLTDHIPFAGYVPQADLPLWYNAASLFVYPSLFEGFGLPVLEAMACGTPVITSNVSSLPEVAGEAAITVSPTDTAALSQAMERVFRNPELAQSLKEKGLRQAATFSWQKTAAETVAVYRKILRH